MRIVVLGGSGMMGCISTQDLAQDRRVTEVVIGARNMPKAKEVAEAIGSPKITIRQVDVTDHDALVGVLKGADACLNATVYYTNLQVMEACLEAGVHYTDMGGLFHTTRKQLELSDRFAEAGLSAVLGMGSAPGVPNVQARYAADRLDTIEYIRIYDGIKPPPPGDVRFTYAVPTIVDELTLPPMVYRDGEFLACEPLSEFENYWFAPPIGLLPMHLSLHSEVATLPLTFQNKGVRECFFKINYWGMAKETVEKIRVLVDFGFAGREAVEVKGQRVIPRDLLVAMMANYVPPITDFLAPPKNRPPDWVKEIVTEVQGTRDGEKVTYRMGTLTCKGALPTGVAPARAAIWLAEKRIPAGVHPPEAVIDPVPFFKELEQRDIYTRVSVTEFL
ncbi:MAG: saccharopine dehydrogenase NADP-binding domain-containing protein [Anaerolineae bacterium]|nr:saccharopine dehydrogenase NADP-binding domain-containing protein [Anaerolineae bacterium]MDH7473897.1 saccharopine dehydrogenase NADP-binding domain-containing protein [Anaerolineae bacterium]